MTPDMKFEGLLVSQNVQVLKGMLEILDDLSIDIDVCMYASRAIDLLTKRDIDLVVLDWADGNGASEVARKFGILNGRRKMTVAALVDDHLASKQAIQAGAHVLIKKPLTSKTRCEFRTQVYSRMVQEWREQPRYAVRWLVAAKDANDNAVPLTLMDLSEGGVGLLFSGNLLVGDVLKFNLLLHGTKQIIRFDARVLWTVTNNRAGAEFVNIPAADSDILRKWLHEKRVNKLNSGVDLPFVIA